MTYYTHGGLFHCDEVTGYAIVSLAEVCNEFVRLIDLNDIPATGLVADIGRIYDPEVNRFDHHQDFLQRPDGYPYASAGFLWKEFGHLVVGQRINSNSTFIQKVVNEVDQVLIRGIDAHDADNAYRLAGKCSAGDVTVMSLPMVIGSFNSLDIHNRDEQDSRFSAAASLMKNVIISAIDSATKYIKDVDRFDEIAEIQGTVIVLPEPVSWKRIVCERFPNTLFVISPSGHPGNKYSMIAVPVSPDSRELKRSIERPEWFSGFIHQGKWIAGSNEIDELLKLAEFNS